MSAIVDHCTLWFEGTWAQCCAAHDLAYANPAVDRLTADIDLAVCVAHSGWPLLVAPIGGVMLIGVRVFGWWFRARPLRSAEEPRR